MKTVCKITDITLQWVARLEFQDEGGKRLGEFGLIPPVLKVSIDTLPEEVKAVFDEAILPYLQYGSLRLLQEKYDHQHRE